MKTEYNGTVTILMHKVGWYYRNNDGKIKELPECEEEHIKECIEDGYDGGQLCYYHCENNTDKEYYGWWRIIGG